VKRWLCGLDQQKTQPAVALFGQLPGALPSAAGSFLGNQARVTGHRLSWRATPMVKRKISLSPRPALVLAGVGVLLCGALLTRVPAGRLSASPREPFPRIAPYYPTPMFVVEKMLEVAAVGSRDVVYDLGSGDGRIVIMAAQKFGARAVGIEINPTLWQESSDRLARLGLEGRARILHEDMFKTSIRPATVVTLFLLPGVLQELAPQLERELRPGTRIVAQEFPVPGWEPQKVERVKSEAGVSYTIYLYVRP
jgi:protein-L-isoaspartate O-methyltransferase